MGIMGISGISEIFSNLVERLKGLFSGNSKKIKFFALMFVIIVLLYLAVSPLPAHTIETIEEVGSLGSFSLKGLGKKVRFADNLVTHVWYK